LALLVAIFIFAFLFGGALEVLFSDEIIFLFNRKKALPKSIFREKKRGIAEMRLIFVTS